MKNTELELLVVLLYTEFHNENTQFGCSPIIILKQCFNNAINLPSDSHVFAKEYFASYSLSPLIRYFYLVNSTNKTSGKIYSH